MSAGAEWAVPGQGQHLASLSWLLTESSLGKRESGVGGAVANQLLSDLLPALLHHSNAREKSQRVTDFFKYGNSGYGEEDSMADQFANKWGRSGRDPNYFRPRGLPDKY